MWIFGTPKEVLWEKPLRTTVLDKSVLPVWCERSWPRPHTQISSRLMPEVRCPHTFSHVMMNLSALNVSVCTLVSLLPELLHWGRWWPTSPSIGASLYHAGLPIAWCRLSRVPLTHLGPYLPPSGSLEKTGRGEIFYSTFLWFPLPPNFLSRGITSYLSPWLRQKVTLIYLLQNSFFPDLFDIHSTAVITVCHHRLCLFIKGKNG